MRHEAPWRLVNVDRVCLEQALTNLIVNAVAYGPPGAQVDVLAEVRPTRVDDAAPAPEASPVPAEASALTLVIDVLDRGPGIPEDLRARMFQPFDRGPDTPGEGSGLGLATVAAAARAHHGTIVVSAREGGGTCFRLEVPA